MYYLLQYMKKYVIEQISTDLLTNLNNIIARVLCVA
jgi:hypothetical protein